MSLSVLQKFCASEFDLRDALKVPQLVNNGQDAAGSNGHIIIVFTGVSLSLSDVNVKAFRFDRGLDLWNKRDFGKKINLPDLETCVCTACKSTGTITDTIDGFVEIRECRRCFATGVDPMSISVGDTLLNYAYIDLCKKHLKNPLFSFSPADSNMARIDHAGGYGFLMGLRSPHEKHFNLTDSGEFVLD